MLLQIIPEMKQTVCGNIYRDTEEDFCIAHGKKLQAHPVTFICFGVHDITIMAAISSLSMNVLTAAALLS